MPSAELSVPDNVEIDDVDDEAPWYKRAVALVVVLITLFGSVVAYLQAVDSNAEDRAARDAERDAITGLGSQVDSSAALAADLRIGSELDVQLQRQAINAGRVNNFSGDVDTDVHLAAAERYAAVRAAVAELTPIDPSDPSTIDAGFALANETPDAARLRQAVEADRADDHGGRADSYVAVLTVLAVALFLLGLSLTVQGRIRFVLAAPGVLIAIVCVGWTALIWAQDVTQVSERAIQATAEGQRLANAGDLEGAIEAYDLAIDDSPEFAAAFARRADARFLQGSAQISGTGFVSITSEDALDDALDDIDRALELGADDDVATVGGAGFFAFLDRDFERSAALSTQALGLNDQLAQVWFNLGVAEVALGDERAATRAYREGRQLLAANPNAGERDQILAGARTDLSVLRELLTRSDLDDVIDLIESVEGKLAAFDASLVDVPCNLDSCPGPEGASNGAAIDETTIRFTPSGAFVFADYTVQGVAAGTPLTHVWYLRVEDGVPFEQAGLPSETVRVGEDNFVSTVTLPSLDPFCPVAADYLVRVYAGERFIGELNGTLEPGPLGNQFTSVIDPVEGYEACVPVDFTVDRADVTALDAFTTFGTDDLIIGLNVTPGALAEGIDPVELNTLVLEQIMELDRSELIEMTLQGRDLEGNFIPIPALAGINVIDGFPTMTVSAIGPDASSRNITITGSDDFAVLEQAVALIQFTGIAVDDG